MFASTLRWRMTTPFGSAVAPDVKMIWMTSSRVIGDVRHRPVGAASRGRRDARPATSAARPDVACRLREPLSGTSSPTQDQPRVDQARARCATNSADER